MFSTEHWKVCATHSDSIRAAPPAQHRHAFVADEQENHPARNRKQKRARLGHGHGKDGTGNNKQIADEMLKLFGKLLVNSW